MYLKISRLATHEYDSCLVGIFYDFIVNKNKLGNTKSSQNETLIKLLNGIGDLATENYTDSSINPFADAFEILMTNYATNSGKSGGEFFTPLEISELLVRLTVAGKDSVNKVYDPACGTGSLLLKFTKVLGKEGIRNGFFWSRN